MAWRFSSLAAAALLGACRPAPDPKVDTASDGGGHGGACESGYAPEITALAIERGADTAEGPALMVDLDAEDADGDLTAYQVEIWFDSDVDGSVERTDFNRIAPGPVTLDAPPCGAAAIHSEIEIVMLGSDVLDFDTLYEFAAVITDAAGLSSAPALTTAKTPTED